MKTYTQCGVCKDNLFTNTKAEAGTNLMRHIQTEHPDDWAWVRARREDIAKIQKSIQEIRAEVRARTGWEVPGW